MDSVPRDLKFETLILYLDDAREEGLGAVLNLTGDDGSSQVLAHASRVLSKAKRIIRYLSGCLGSGDV